MAKASYRLQVERCLCALEDGGTLLLPGLQFAFQLHVLLPGITVYFSVELFAPRFFFATRYNREEYSLLLAAFTFCLPLSPFACRLERVVDPGQQRVERKNAIPGSISVLLPGFILRFPKKSGNTSRFNREDFSNREHHTKRHILPRYRPWIPEKYREEFSKTGKIGL